MIAPFLIALLAAQLATGAAQPQTPPPAAPVEIVLFSDFQCPFCQQFSAPFRELQTKGLDGVQTKVQFKNFPLSIHSNAQIAHQAAMAAREQGKFWEMHDLLFANQSAVKREDLLGYAKKLGLNLTRFTKDLDSERIKDEIKADVAEGEKRGVSGTPTFFVNGKGYSGTRSFDQLKQLVLSDEKRRTALAEVTDSLMTKGPADAPVTLEFFADLQSPVSRPAIDVIEQVIAHYPSSIRIQFRNFPLAFHPQAALAHEAAMTAARKGLFWEFAAFCLDHQDSLREQDLIAYAGRLGLDETQFAETIQQHRYAARVDADLESGLQRGIRGSPTVLVNGKKIDGVPNLETLTQYVEAELASHETKKP
jgi:protein-disulfide isomerase